MRHTNWAGNVTWSASRREAPSSLAELQGLVAASTRLHAVGTGHSFSTTADTTGTQVSLERLPQQIDLDTSALTVSVSAGLRFGELAPVLHAQGYALRTLGSLPHIGVAGAVATGTHGSGDGHGALAAEVRTVELVTATGDLLVVGRGDDRFPGLPVSLGALGVVVRLVLAVVPTFEIEQRVYDTLAWDVALDRLDDVLAAAYSVSLFTRWDPAGVDQVWLKHRVGDPAGPGHTTPWLGARPAGTPRHPLPGDDPAACTTQLGVPGPWHERLPHFRLDHTPSHGEELQSEYLVDRCAGAAALAAVLEVRGQVRPSLLVSEIRSVAADGLWLSPASGRDSVAIHFTWRPDPVAVAPAVAAVEAALAPYDPRPHWGKVFATPQPDLAARYPHYERMRALVTELDPRGVFRNAFLDDHLPSP